MRAEEPVISAQHLAGTVGLAFVILMSGCAVLGTPPPDTPSPIDPPRAGAETAAPRVPEPSAPNAPPSMANEAGVTPLAPASDSGTLAMGAPATPNAGKTDPRAASAPAKVPAAPAPAAQPAKRATSPSAGATAKAPPLDLASLEQQLKDTKAIGVLTKITLKNQVDDLLNQFRAFYQGTLKTDLANLRRSYDLLVLKVLSLLQDNDRPLATAIVASREAIWGILSDPAKFATI